MSGASSMASRSPCCFSKETYARYRSSLAPGSRESSWAWAFRNAGIPARLWQLRASVCKTAGPRRPVRLAWGTLAPRRALSQKTKLYRLLFKAAPVTYDPGSPLSGTVCENSHRIEPVGPTILVTVLGFGRWIVTAM